MTSGNPTEDPRSAELTSTRVSQPPADNLQQEPSRRHYGAGDCVGGKYRLESLLGRGGMGEVWTASNETLAVQRAVKLIRSEAECRENTDRLLHEARAAARLADPAIVRVFDFGKTQYGDPFLVMEVLRGEDLASAIRRKERLKATRAVRILLPVIRALGLAHLHGIVHRDLKPENIFLTKGADGRIQPKLLDFGIAKLKDMQSLRLTMDGSVMGSPLYMAPEQARGEEVDERADIWALCVVLYEIISGDPPFLGETRSEVFTAATRTVPKSLPSLGFGDETLWQVLLRGLSKNPKSRYQSMRELGQALASWLLTQQITDDITGASLNASWFRESPQSFLSSTVPPGRPSLIAPKAKAFSPPAASPLTRRSLTTKELPDPVPPASVSAAQPLSGLPWPTWLNTKWERGAAAAAVVLTVGVLPWALSAPDKPPPSSPLTEVVSPPSASQPEQVSPSLPASPSTEPGSPSLSVEYGPPPPSNAQAQPHASAPSETLSTPETDSSPPPTSKPSRKARKTLRRRTQQKRRSRLMDPYQ